MNSVKGKSVMPTQSTSRRSSKTQKIPKTPQGDKEKMSKSKKSKAQSAKGKVKSQTKSMMDGKGKFLAAAVGVATAAAAGIVAFKTASGKSRTVYHLMPHKDGWQVRKGNSGKPELVREHKQDARSEARDLAHDHEPSQLVIHRTDGTIQTVHTYGG